MRTSRILRKASHKPGSVHPIRHADRTDCHLSGTDVTVSVYRSTLQASRLSREENEQLYSPGLHDLSAREVCLASECHHRNGELLPPLFTITRLSSEKRRLATYFLLHFLYPISFPNGSFPLGSTVTLCCPDFPP